MSGGWGACDGTLPLNKRFQFDCVEFRTNKLSFKSNPQILFLTYDNELSVEISKRFFLF